MRFILEEAKLWRNVKATTIASSFLILKKDNDEDWIKKIYACNKKICEFQDNICKAISKIGKMYSKKVPKKFLLAKTSRD